MTEGMLWLVFWGSEIQNGLHFGKFVKDIIPLRGKLGSQLC